MPDGGLIAFCLIQMLGFAALASIGKSVLHADALPPMVLEHALLVLSIVRLLGIWLWTLVAERTGVPAALVSAYFASACSILPLPSAIASGPWQSAFALCLIGVSSGGVVLLSWSSFSERLALVQQRDARTDAASSYGLFTASSKIGLGLSGFLAGAWVGRQGDSLTTQALWPMATLIAGICLAAAILNWSGRYGGTRAVH